VYLTKCGTGRDRPGLSGTETILNVRSRTALDSTGLRRQLFPGFRCSMFQYGLLRRGQLLCRFAGHAKLLREYDLNLDFRFETPRQPFTHAKTITWITAQASRGRASGESKTLNFFWHPEFSAGIEDLACKHRSPRCQLLGRWGGWQAAVDVPGQIPKRCYFLGGPDGSFVFPTARKRRYF
jgi:hypothetical protein